MLSIQALIDDMHASFDTKQNHGPSLQVTLQLSEREDTFHRQGTADSINALLTKTGYGKFYKMNGAQLYRRTCHKWDNLL